MLVYRLSKRKYKEPLSGIGASTFGARWNSPGTEIVYTSSSRSLAVTEILVQIDRDIMPSDYILHEINIPDKLNISIVDLNRLPKGWDNNPILKCSQNIGDDFINKKKYCILKVPSAVIKGEYGILINPRHKDFTKIYLKSSNPFNFDTRLFRPSMLI